MFTRDVQLIADKLPGVSGSHNRITPNDRIEVRAPCLKTERQQTQGEPVSGEKRRAHAKRPKGRR